MIIFWFLLSFLPFFLSVSCVPVGKKKRKKKKERKKEKKVKCNPIRSDPIQSPIQWGYPGGWFVIEVRKRKGEN